VPRTRDEAEHEATKAHIKAIARAQMAAAGTAGLSLRAIAREMDMTAPALYRYFPKLDDLITALIVDAFNGVADALETADAGAADPTDYEGRLTAVCLAYRKYALDYPVDFQLIYGNPIPGYNAPREITVPAATRVHVAMTRVLVEADAAGRFHHPFTGKLAFAPNALANTVLIAQQFGVKPELIATAMVLWTSIHSVVTLDLDGHIESAISADALYDMTIRLFLERFIS